MLRIAWASLGIAGDERAACAGSGFGFAKDLDPFIDLLFEFVFVDEAVDDLQGAEKMTAAFAERSVENEGRRGSVS